MQRRIGRIWGVGLGAVLAAGLAACSPTPTNVGHGYTPTGAPGLLHAKTPAGAALVIKDYQFVPDHLTVKAGTRIVVINQGRAAHTVTAKNNAFNVGPIGQGGGDATFTVSKPGTYPFYDELHRSMQGVLTVTG